MSRILLLGLCFICTLCCAHQVQAQVPDEFKTQAGKMIGTWIVEETKGEIVTKGEFTAEWSVGGETVVWNYKQTEPTEGSIVTGSGLFGWDGRRKKIVEVGFWSTGEAIVGIHEMGDDKWTCQTRITVDGDEGVKNGQTHRNLHWKSADELEIVATKVFVNHRPKPDYTTVFRRKQEPTGE